MSNEFNCKDGKQNIAQDENGLGKQVNNVFCRLMGRIFISLQPLSQAVSCGISPQMFTKYVAKLAPPLPASSPSWRRRKLREIAAHLQGATPELGSCAVR